MKRSVLGAILLSLAFLLMTAGSARLGAEESFWTLKYQILAPHHFVVEKIVPVKDPANPDLPKLEKVFEKYWYQVLYLKNPLKKKIEVSFDTVLIVDPAKTVRCPKCGEVIDVSHMMPGFAGEGPNFVYCDKCKTRIVIPGKAFRPVYEPVIRDKIIEKIKISRVREHKFVNCFRNSAPLTLKPLPTYVDYLDMNKPMGPEELRQVIIIFKGLDPGFDRLVFRYGGLTNEYVFSNEGGNEEGAPGRAQKKILQLEYYRPGDEFAPDDTNPEEVDIFHLRSSEWFLQPLG